jgi:hypothetical protein
MNLINTHHMAVPCGWKREPTLVIRTALVGSRQRAIARVVAVLVLLGILVGATQSYAQAWTQVQGQLIGNGYYGPTPVGGVMLTLFNWQVGRSKRSISRPDGTFYFRNVPLGWYNVEVWFPNNPYPQTFKVVVNQMPVSNVGMIQLNMPMDMPRPQGVGGIPGQPGWVQTGF